MELQLEIVDGSGTFGDCAAAASLSSFASPSGELTLKEARLMRGRQVIQDNLGSVGGVCFVVRRPG
jgi:hypothetical protein